MIVKVKRVQFKNMVSATWLNETSLDIDRAGAMMTITYNRDEREFVVIDNKTPHRLPVVVPVENVASYEPLPAEKKLTAAK